MNWVILIVVLVLLAVAKCTVDLVGSMSDVCNVITAKSMVKGHLKERVRWADTFVMTPGLDGYTLVSQADDETCVWDVGGEFTAENSFGMVVRSRYSGRLDRNSDGWRVQYLTIE